MMKIGLLTALIASAAVAVACSQPVGARSSVPRVGAGLQNAVTLDAKMSSTDEWADAAVVDVDWGLNIPPSAPLVHVRVWVKNDSSYLYLMYRVEWPRSDADLHDGGQIARFWGTYGPPWEHSDVGFVGLDGTTADGYGWNNTNWSVDDDAGGQNNVEGIALHDGTYYWVEMRKRLCSNDGYDWCLSSGRTYHLLAGVWDNSIRQEYHQFLDVTIH